METQTTHRKLAHIQTAIQSNVAFRRKSTWLEYVELIHNAIPEIELEKIDTSTEIVDKQVNAPIMVAAITGGHPTAERINKDIAEACEELGLAIGLGSQRAMMEKPELQYTYYVRDVAPSIPLFGNIGVIQAKKYDTAQIQQAIQQVEADGLFIHTNPGQEAIQPEGDHDFTNTKQTIMQLTQALDEPVLIKEVGMGISKEIATDLKEMGIYGIDIGGAGGTSWIGFEAIRRNDSIGNTFWDWGIPTAASILEVKSAYDGKIIATGGIRTGLDVAKAIVLGADIAGIALPIITAQQKGGKTEVKRVLEQIIQELRIAMFVTGSKNISDLKTKKYVLFDKLKEWVTQRQL